MTEFEQVYAEQYPVVYKYALSLCRDPAMAEDLAQEAFVKAMEHMDRFDGKCQLYVWICQIAKNTYYSYLRKQKHTARGDWAPEPAEAGPEEALLDRETAGQIRELFHQLPEPYREVFSLRVFGGLSFGQIGGLFGKTDSWARLIFFRAKQRIKEDLNE